MSDTHDSSETQLPLVEESLLIDKTWVESGRVRVTTRPVTEFQRVEADLRQQSIRIERTPVEQYVDEMPQARQEGDVWVIPVVEEVLVIEKRLLLREEIRVIRDETTVTFDQTVPLQHDELRVEHRPSEDEEAARTS